VPVLRPATVEDAVSIAAIYEPIVRDTAISFEIEPPGPAEMASRIRSVTATHPWLVAEDGNGSVIGFAYAGVYKSRPAYRWSVETTVYVDEAHHGHGVGRLLYSTLLDTATDLGYVTAYAGIALPNAASEALHAGLGFERIGVFRRAGFKLGQWHDVVWWQRPLSPADPPFSPLLP
jgi:L-amino acid N-acyltransferase YncA